MLEIGYISQMRKHIPHNIDDSICTTLTLCRVLNCQCMIYHILDTPPILGKRHSFLLSVILHINELKN